jgi:Zn-dependent peptidase ImmA (M78 family)
MVRLLESRGVRVFSLSEQGQEVDAFSCWQAARPFIFLNTVKSAERSRFDCAHELAHLVLHRHAPNNGRPAEQEADMFASAFLMPRASVLAHAPRNATVERLIRAKAFWNVSVGALARRMAELGLVSEWQYRTLAIEIQNRGFRTAEPESSPREMSLVFDKVFSALSAEGIRKQDVARELAWPVAELNALIFGLFLSARAGGEQASDPLRRPDLRLL